MTSGQATAPAHSALAQDEGFQGLLHELTAALAESPDDTILITRFCALARNHLKIDAVHAWRLLPDGQMHGFAADGFQAETFSKIRVPVGHPLVATVAVERREPVCVVCPSPEQYPLVSEFRVSAILSAPLIVAGDVIGAVSFVSVEEAAAFTPALTARAVALTGTAGALMAIARLGMAAATRERELQQMLQISSELNATRNTGEFVAKFLVRAAEMLGFSKAFIALRENDVTRVRWIADGRNAHEVSHGVPAGIQARVITSMQPVWSDDAVAITTPDSPFEFSQYLALPLTGSDGRLTAILALLDRADRTRISTEHVRAAQALAAELAVALESAQHLADSERHRRRNEDLVNLVLELNSSLRSSDFLPRFAEGAAAMLKARAVALALVNRRQVSMAVLRDSALASSPTFVGNLNAALAAAMNQSSEPIVAGNAAAILGEALAGALNWRDLTLATIHGFDGDALGVLCLADRNQPLTSDDRTVLQALCSHASVALENARLFARMENANRHWIEIFDAITDFIVVHDESYNVLRVNRSLADFIGVQPPELIGVKMHALLATAEFSDHGVCPFCKAGETEEYVHPILDRTYLISTSHIVTSPTDTQTIHVLKDITDRREAERRYRELFDNIQEGLFFSSPDGRFIEVNDALVRMFGYESRDELLQIDIASKMYVTPEHRQRFIEQMQSSNGTVRNYEETLRRKDGSLVYTLQNAFAVRDTLGRIVQYRGLMLDITELKTFQAELQRERDFSSKILNNTQSMILVADTAGLISYANRRCYDAGHFANGKLLGKRLITLVAPHKAIAFQQAIDSTIAGQQVDNLELPIVLGSGRVAQFSVNLSPMRDEGGHVTSLVVVMTDITDVAILQAKLMHTEKMAAIGQLVSGVAHEVNNPLTAVLGFTDLLLEHPGVPDDAKHDLQIILQESQRTKQIVQNLLSFARQTPAQREQVQVNELLRRTVALRAYDFANHNVSVVTNLDDAVPPLLADQQQLQQVFLNILNNAYDAVHETGRGGEIVITSRYQHGHVDVSFRDNGPGIRHPDRIFDPFFTTKEVGKGTGLGLSICYGIVHEHEGEITCGNNSDGHGATFTVRIPATAANAAVTGVKA